MTECRRRPWLAALLSFGGGPIGHVYAGALSRCICIWIAGILVALIALILILYAPNVRIGYASLVALAICYAIVVPVDAYRTACRLSNAQKHSYQRWWVYLLLMVFFVTFNTMEEKCIRWQIAESFQIPSRGMSDTILPGDRILVNKLHYHLSALKRGDVVVFFSDGPDTPLWVQRVVGLPGDDIEIRNEKVFLNGTKIDEPYARFEALVPSSPKLTNYGPARVPEDNVFLLGDNRRLSHDSRMKGFVPKSGVIGLARMIYWSREWSFPNPTRSNQHEEGGIRWERFGLRIQ